jgi:vacuolar-type H+-ATPase subunit E/Vma4
MAIRIPILTSFDPKGLKQANAAFAGLQSSIGSLGANFAIAGTAIVAGTALLSKAVMSASNFEAEFEGVNQVFKDAAGSVQAFAESAAQTAGLSATEALKASKTFGLFATGAGLGTTEAAKFSTTMVQLAGDLGSFNDVPTADALAAIQSGLMGQAEPLRNFGVFLDDLTLKQALFDATGQKVTGTLTTQQKMVAAYTAILDQTTVQQGDFVKYQETLGNQLKTVGTEFENLTRDIGVMLIPTITAAMPFIREMATELGEKLKAAIESVDWKSLTTTIVNLATFFVTNAENIAKLVTAIFVLNTAFKLMSVASGIVSTAIALQTWFTAKLAAGMTIASVASTILSAAMRLIPFVAVATAIGFVVTGIIELGDESKRNKPYVDNYGGAIRKTGDDALWAANAYGIAAQEVDNYNDAITKPKDSVSRDRRHQLREENRRLGKIGSGLTAPTMPDFSSLLNSMTSGSGSGGFQAELDKLNREAEKAASDAAKAMADIEADASREAENAAREAQNAWQQIQDAEKDARDEATRAEQAVLDKRLSAFESFNNSVKNLFGQIKDSILSSFNLPTLGNSVNSITRNIGKLLEKTKGFAGDIAKISGLGLNSALLQQVIQAGPVEGSRLASAIATGGSSFVDQLNAAYGEMGGLASGIAGVGTSSAFANQAVVNNYNIEVTGGVGSGPTIGRAIVDAIKSYERTSGAVWQGAS